MPSLLLATRNAHKTAEVRAILAPTGWTVSDLLAHPDWPEVEETGTTFADNAALKALAASAWLPGAVVLADDSGLEVDALDGAPGVFSARYAGPGADDAANRRRLLAELTRVGALGGQPAARFRCHITLARNGTRVADFDGTVEGTLVPAERGTGGFGYDPLFVPEGCQQTFGELSAEVKNHLSHRARALAQAIAFLRREDDWVFLSASVLGFTLGSS